MDEPLQIVVTGARGFVARNLRRHLSENGVHLISISRKNFATLKNETKIISDGYQEKSIISEIRNSDALVHLAGAGRQSAKTDYCITNSELTRSVVDLAQRAKIKRLIYTSGLGVSSNASLEYFISKFRAERSIIDSKINYTIFRPSYIVGRDDLLTTHLKKSIKKNRIIIPGTGRYLIQPVFIDDVTKLIRLSATRAKFRNKIIDLVGPETVSFKRYVRLFLQDQKPKICHMDIEDAYRHAISGSGSDYNIDDLNILVGSFTGDHKRLSDISGMQFQSVVKLLKTGALL